MAQRRHYEEDYGEREPLDHSNFYSQKQSYPSPNYRQEPYHQPQQYQQYQQQNPYSNVGAQPRARPKNAHPDSSFERLRARRRYSQERSDTGARQAVPAAAAVGTGAAMENYRHHQTEDVPVASAPQVPQHYNSTGGDQWRQGYDYRPQQGTIQNNITPGADNFGDAAAGGMAGIAYTVAERNARESGVDALRGPDYPQQAYQQQGQWQDSRSGAYSQRQPQSPYARNVPANRDSDSSTLGLSAAALPPGNASPGVRTPSRSPHSFATDAYSDDPYMSYSSHLPPNLGVVNPHEIDDDGDDGVNYGRKGARTSMLSLGGRDAAVAAGAVGAAAATGGVIGALSGRNGSGGQYAPVNNASTAYEGAGGNTSAYNLPNSGAVGEKSQWKSSDGARGRKWRLIILITLAVLILVGVVVGVVLGIVLKNKNGSKSSSSTSSGSSGDDGAGDLNIDSPEIQALLNNKNLHKVFPGIDYTPVNTQYPDCLTNPPSQNNVTKDVAVLSQLTNTIRLYGTDCNQTEMLIHAVTQLKMEDTISIWMGVWQDNNASTNARQLSQMWDILDAYGDKYFKGIIVANEILFRQQMNVTELGSLLRSVRSNATAKGWNLPVATSDLGDNWTSELAQDSDYIMANIHPFFGGINANDAASWTWSFWENHNANFFKSDNAKNVISETGWPSQGGTDCGSDSVTDCPDAAVAGISQMNQFMSDWVCQALTNGTQYFWFESFDEPWKISFDSGSQNWEDHWGLMDVDRNLKSGVTIPDCDGKTV
jgi:exo-beta-1,3-glucanase (GH17 family)